MQAERIPSWQTGMRRKAGCHTASRQQILFSLQIFAFCVSPNLPAWTSRHLEKCRFTNSGTGLYRLLWINTSPNSFHTLQIFPPLYPCLWLYPILVSECPLYFYHSFLCLRRIPFLLNMYSILFLSGLSREFNTLSVDVSEIASMVLKQLHPSPWRLHDGHIFYDVRVLNWMKPLSGLTLQREIFARVRLYLRFVFHVCWHAI